MKPEEIALRIWPARYQQLMNEFVYVLADLNVAQARIKELEDQIGREAKKE